MRWLIPALKNVMRWYISELQQEEGTFAFAVANVVVGAALVIFGFMFDGYSDIVAVVGFVGGGIFILAALRIVSRRMGLAAGIIIGRGIVRLINLIKRSTRGNVMRWYISGLKQKSKRVHSAWAVTFVVVGAALLIPGFMFGGYSNTMGEVFLMFATALMGSGAGIIIGRGIVRLIKLIKRSIGTRGNSNV